MIHFICKKSAIYNGIHYRAHQSWDGDLPCPQLGEFWTILQSEDPNPGLKPKAR